MADLMAEIEAIRRAARDPGAPPHRGRARLHARLETGACGQGRRARPFLRREGDKAGERHGCARTHGRVRSRCALVSTAVTAPRMANGAPQHGAFRGLPGNRYVR